MSFWDRKLNSVTMWKSDKAATIKAQKDKQRNKLKRNEINRKHTF